MAAPAQSPARTRAAGPAATGPTGADELMLAFVALELRLSSLVQEALVSRRLDTVQQRRRFQREAHRLIEQVRGDFRGRAGEVLEAAYGRGVKLVGARPPGAIQRSVLETLTRNATGRLDSALNTIGRQFDDTFRRVGIEQAARQLTRELPEHAAADVMRRELMKRGLTGFVDKRGRHWRLETYSRMVVRTASSEAANRGVADAMQAVGRDLARVSDDNCRFHQDDPLNPCRALEGKIVSLTGRTHGYPVLERIPPFHPNCEHFIAPAPEGVR